MEIIAIGVFMALVVVISNYVEKKSLNTTTTLMLGQLAFFVSVQLFILRIGDTTGDMKAFSIGLLCYFAITIPVSIIIENASERNKSLSNVIGFGVLALIASMFLFTMISLLYINP